MKEAVVAEANLRIVDDIDPLDVSESEEEDEDRMSDSEFTPSDDDSEEEEDVSNLSDDDAEPLVKRPRTNCPSKSTADGEDAMIEAADTMLAEHAERSRMESLPIELRNLVKAQTVFICCAADCGKRFDRKADIERHLLIHLGIKNFVCDECEARFTRKGDLVIHKQSHAKDQRFVCDFPGCGKSYTLRNNLSRHKKSCHESKRYPCPQCDKTFSQSGDLKRHQAVHSGARPFACAECGAGFRQKAHLVQHGRTHAKRQQAVCGEV